MKALFIYENFETAKWNRSIMVLAILFTVCVSSGYGEDVMKTEDVLISNVTIGLEDRESSTADGYPKEIQNWN